MPRKNPEPTGRSKQKTRVRDGLIHMPHSIHLFMPVGP